MNFCFVYRIFTAFAVIWGIYSRLWVDWMKQRYISKRITRLACLVCLKCARSFGSVRIGCKLWLNFLVSSLIISESFFGIVNNLYFHNLPEEIKPSLNVMGTRSASFDINVSKYVIYVDLIAAGNYLCGLRTWTILVLQ